jgi:hypothetical protein
MTEIAASASGIAPVNVGSGATVTVNTWNPDPTVDNSFHLSIPGLGLETDFTSKSLLKGASTTVAGGGGLRLTTSNTNYVTLGLWEVDANPNGVNTIFSGAFFTGYPATTVPTSGTATYAGTHNVSAVVTSEAGGQFSQASVLGNGTFNADFGANSLTGNFTKMFVFATSTNAGATTLSPPTPWNDVSVSATISGTGFSGTATAGVTNGGANATVTPNTATGLFNGKFYGPAANGTPEELGSAWSLMDSTHVVVGVAVGKKQ